MIDHVVFFKLTASITPEQEQELIGKAKALKTAIEGIVEISFGRSITSARAKGYTHGLRVLFENAERLDHYGPHPEHQAFVKRINELADNAQDTPMVLDWERPK